MVEKQRLGKALDGMAAGRIPGAATLITVRPDDRMIARHRPACIGSLVERREDVDAPPRVVSKVVPLVPAHPGLRKRGGGRLPWRFHVDGRRLDVGMTREVGTYQRSIEGPVV